MEITLIAGLAILFMTLVIFIYLGIRNNQVYVFSMHIINCSHEEVQRVIYEDIDRAKQLYSRLDEIYNRNSYDEMLYSIRPLKVKYWFTEEEIKTFNLSDL